VVVDGRTSWAATFEVCRRAVLDHPRGGPRAGFVDPNQVNLATGDVICHKLEIANDLRKHSGRELVL
jgi:hypothetical protein